METARTQGEGAAWITPWSGHWYPEEDTGQLNLYDDDAALDLYDRYVQKTRGYDPGAQQWERENHRTSDPNLGWAGHCHAWAAASMLTREAPREGVTRAGIHFDQDALEGLKTALYYNPSYHMLPGGVRSNTDDPNAVEFKDMNPAWMHYLLQYYLQQHNYPIVMDTVAGAQVWNFPAFAYRSTQSANTDGSVDVSTRVWFSDARAGVSGAQHFFKDYTYTLRNTGDGHMTGEWTGDSIQHHPDFAWVPTGKQQGGDRNPRIDERVVEEILGYDV